jgi:hypothetical protein
MISKLFNFFCSAPESRSLPTNDILPIKPSLPISNCATVEIRNTPTIFFDVDGVLHPYETGSLASQKYLVELCKSIPNLQLVMSSNWRESSDYDYFRSEFSTEIVRSTVGFTPVYDEYRFNRQKEIEDFAKYYGIQNYLVLDDLEHLFEPRWNKLYLVDRKTGLKPSDLPPIVTHLTQA